MLLLGTVQPGFGARMAREAADFDSIISSHDQETSISR
jgi:hypothetical protein